LFRILSNKPNSWHVFILFLLLIIVSNTSVFAASGYISNHLVVSLKNSIEEPNEVVTRVQTGDKVEIIGTKGKFMLVETEQGDQGWMNKQYLLFTKPKEVSIKLLREKNEKLREQLALEKKNNAKKLEDLRRTYDTNSKQTLLVEKVAELEQIMGQRDELLQKTQQLQLSIQALETEQTRLKENEKKHIELKNDRKALKEKVTQLRLQLDNKSQELTNKGLNIDPRIPWFLAGGFILFFGFLIGKSSKKRKKTTLSF